MDRHHKDTLPWYRQPLVWMLICIPGSAIVSGIITINLAIQSDDGLVTDDYYKKGLEINRDIERDQKAVDHGLEARITAGWQQQQLQIRLSANPDYNLPRQILVEFTHATRGGYDNSLVIDAGEEGIYSSVLPELVNGRWNVQISADDWRLMESLSVRENKAPAKN